MRTIPTHVRVCTIAVTAAAVMTAAGAALAADLYALPPPAAQSPVYSPTPAHDWSGPYLGVQGGGDFNRAATVSTLCCTASINGGMVGIYGGYNWQRNNIVFGVDASVNYGWGSAAVVGAPAGYTGEVDWKGFLRGRLGVAVANNVLLYGTAGASYANLKLVSSGTTLGNPSGWGWTVGAGAEWAFRPNMTARIDYTYADYGTYSYSSPVSFTATNASHTVMLGLAMTY